MLIRQKKDIREMCACTGLPSKPLLNSYCWMHAGRLLQATTFILYNSGIHCESKRKQGAKEKERNEQKKAAVGRKRRTAYPRKKGKKCRLAVF